MNDERLNSSEEKTFLKILRKVLNKQKILILADYGHGEITDNVRKKYKNIQKIYF